MTPSACLGPLLGNGVLDRRWGRLEMAASDGGAGVLATTTCLGFVPVIAEAAERLLGEWRRDDHAGATRNIDRDMTLVTFDVISPHAAAGRGIARGAAHRPRQRRLSETARLANGLCQLQDPSLDAAPGLAQDALSAPTAAIGRGLASSPSAAPIRAVKTISCSGWPMPRTRRPARKCRTSS